MIPTQPLVKLTCSPFKNPSSEDGGNYVVRATNPVGEKDCTLALNFGGGPDNEENVPARYKS